ncbi:TfuA-like protein [Rhizobium sp. Leaf341]|uniref:TfuA-like protein n=1 Tax=Rhizobium sp. Leaf341 TaxID=1736344 RepID=UPI0007159C91|nr:TfuA-like protein [Rhizobium sp. Leaf341]KQR78032.1 antibiotic resistance protein [Rhizobium sp. Leaf341]
MSPREERNNRKVLFVGPTLPDAARIAPDLEICPPAIQGDVYRAVRAGATAIGLVDGGFEYTAPVWHKEILYALSVGVSVFGAASMGALRAAECHAFGMVGIGAIAQAYADGVLVDDADVAQLHAPAELGWQSLSEPLVNIAATLAQPGLRTSLTEDLCDRIGAAAQRLHFKDRTWRTILRSVDLPDDNRRRAVEATLKASVRNVKRVDALLLVRALQACSNERSREKPDWDFQETTLWQTLTHG